MTTMTTTTTSMNPCSDTYRVRFARVAELEKRVERLNRRAIKLGMAPIGMVIGTPYFFDPKTTDPRSGEPVKGFRVVDVTLTGSAPVVSGWRFCAVLEFTTGGTLVKGVSGAPVIPERFRHSGNKCDHCHTNRNRNSVVVLEKEGEYRQIGTDCIQDYVRNTDAGEALRILSLFEAIKYELANPDADEYSCGGETGYGVIGFLSATACVIEARGWTPRSKETEYSRATVDLVVGAIEDGLIGKKFVVTEAHVKEAEAAIQWARELNPSSDYEHNVQVVCSGGYCSFRNTGILASVIAAYRNSQNRTRERAQSHHVGNVGDKVAWKLTLRSRYIAEGMYGATTILSFLDGDGNVVVWKASGVQMTETDRGSVFLVKGRIKAHTEYKGTPQTQLTRCTVTPA